MRFWLRMVISRYVHVHLMSITNVKHWRIFIIILPICDTIPFGAAKTNDLIAMKKVYFLDRMWTVWVIAKL